MSKQLIVVDKILNDLAVCEKDGTVMDIPLSQINGSVQEGDLLCIDDSGTRYSVQAEETQQRKDALSKRFKGIIRQQKNN